MPLTLSGLKFFKVNRVENNLNRDELKVDYWRHQTATLLASSSLNFFFFSDLSNGEVDEETGDDHEYLPEGKLTIYQYSWNTVIV